MEFRARLLALLQEKKVSQAELARRLGVKAPTVAKILMGRPRTDTVERIAQALGVEARDLVGGTISAPEGWVVIPVYDRCPKKFREPGGAFHPGDADEEEIAGVDVMPIPAKIYAPERAFSLRVRGESASPRFCPGDAVVVDTQAAIVDGDMVLVCEKAFPDCPIMRYRAQGGRVVLVPPNDKFPPIILELGRARVVGKIVGMFRLEGGGGENRVSKGKE